MQKIVKISAKKCYNASSSHDCNFISINYFDRVLLVIGTQLTSQECETPVYQEWVSYNIHTPWSRILLEKLNGSQLDKKFPPFYRTQRFITQLTSARHLFLP